MSRVDDTILQAASEANSIKDSSRCVEVGAVAPADLIAPSPHSDHTYYTPSPTYGNFRFVRAPELIEVQSS